MQESDKTGKNQGQGGQTPRTMRDAIRDIWELIREAGPEHEYKARQIMREHGYTLGKRKE